MRVMYQRMAVWLLWLCLMAVSCQSKDRYAEIFNHAVRQSNYWGNFREIPLDRRVSKATPELIDYLQKHSGFYHLDTMPIQSHEDREIVDSVRLVLKELPDPVQRMAAEKLVGVCLVHHLGASGFAQSVMVSDGQELGAFVVLDSESIAKTANEWFTWREGSPFARDPNTMVVGTIEDDAGDTQLNAIRFLLLHELGHVMQVGERYNPSWHVSPSTVSGSSHPYFEFSWLANEKAYSSRFDGYFGLRDHLKYYTNSGGALDMTQAITAYEQLQQTNFATLYGATNPFDDFAEGFTSYVHSVLGARPYRVELIRDGRILHRYDSCWDEKRCADKKLFFAKLLGPNSNQTESSAATSSGDAHDNIEVKPPTIRR